VRFGLLCSTESGIEFEKIEFDSLPSAASVSKTAYSGTLSSSILYTLRLFPSSCTSRHGDVWSVRVFTDLVLSLYLKVVTLHSVPSAEQYVSWCFLFFGNPSLLRHWRQGVL